MKSYRLYQADAFTTELFRGTPPALGGGAVIVFGTDLAV